MPIIKEEPEVKVVPPPSEWSDDWYQQPRKNSQQKKLSKKKVRSPKPCKSQSSCVLSPVIEAPETPTQVLAQAPPTRVPTVTKTKKKTKTTPPKNPLR